ncbi:MAG: DivIVA domain-containing protein [Actinomycetota bacterium]|nr:DivIVA domain-containing protein [Actinomycetota bacterium]
MSYSPVELRHVKFKRGPIGYRAGSVDRCLEDVVDSFEEVWRERADLADRVEHLESELVRYQELESLLRGTLVSAEKAAHDLREQARREERVILEEAHAEARRITRDAVAEHERLQTELRRVRVLLTAALDAVDDADGEGESAPEAEAA